MTPLATYRPSSSVGTSLTSRALEGASPVLSGENAFVVISPEARPQRSRRESVRVVLISLGFALGMMLIVWGVTGSVTGRESLGLPDAIENLTPSPNDEQVLNQTEVFVDLEANFEAELIVDGITLDTTRLGEVTAEPGRQVEIPPTAVYDPGNASIRFQPQPDAEIEEWSQGVHVITVVFWNVELGRDAARRYTWSFTVL